MTRLADASNGRLVSVVIPCLNEAPFLRTLLDSVRVQEAPIHEVIVVDNGSTDGSGDLVTAYQREHPEWPLRLMTCSTPGAAAAMNVGVAGASSDIIIRLDGHCVPRPDYVRRAVDDVLKEGVGVAGGVWEIMPSRDTRVGRAIATVLTHKLTTGGATYRHPDRVVEATPVDTVPFGCYRKSLWTELGGYDERLQVNEDYVFNYKARMAGWSVLLNPAIRSTYFARETFARLAAQYFQYGWRKADMLIVYPRSVQWRQAVPPAFTAGLAVLAALALFSPTARLVLAAALLLYGVVLLLAAVQVVAPRRAWLSIPACVAAFAIVQLAWGAGACLHLLTLGRWRTSNAGRSARSSAVT